MLLTNSPPTVVPLQLERRKSMSLGVRFTNADDEALDITGCTLTFTLGKRYSTTVLVDTTLNLLTPADGIAQLLLQAADLDIPPGTYDAAITLLTPENYSAAVVKFEAEIIDNPDPSTTGVYAGGGFTSAISVAVGERQELVVKQAVLPPVGDPGLSAYDVAVQAGFVGTVEDWLDSLIGPAGADSTVPGPAGVGIASSTIRYQVSSSGTVIPTGTWQAAVQATSPGQFLWTRTQTALTDGSNVWSYSVAAHGATGAQGNQGIQGNPGPQGNPGNPGADGKTVRNGAGAPAGGTGVDGDFYIDTTAWDIYGPKTAGAWGSPTSLVGTGAWTAYTPTFAAATTNPTLANFTRTGRYQQRGKTVRGVIVITCNNNAGVGAGQYEFGLPVQARNIDEVLCKGAQSGPTHLLLGRGGSNAGIHMAQLWLTSTEAVFNSANGGVINGTVIRIYFEYEAA